VSTRGRPSAPRPRARPAWDNRVVSVARPHLAIGLAACVGAAAAAGAGIAIATAADDDGDAGIVGRALCPVVLDRDNGCSQIKVIVRKRSSGRRVATVKPNRFGRFRVALEPGEYLVELEKAAGTPPAREQEIRVRVRPHRFVRSFAAQTIGPATSSGLVAVFVGVASE
jgi:hypothetical protein